MLCQQQYLGAVAAISGEAVADVTYFNDIGPMLQQQQPRILPRQPQLENNNDNSEIPVLSALFGSDEIRDEFFNSTYGERVAYFPRLPSLTNDNHQQKRCYHTPPIATIDLPTLYKTNEWISLRSRGSQTMLNKTQMNYESMISYINNGGSIIIPITPTDYLYPMKLQFEYELGLQHDTSSMNIYHS